MDTVYTVDTVDIVYTVDMVYTFDMVYTIDMVYYVDTVNTVYIVCAIQTALHCLNSSIYAYIQVTKGFNAIGRGWCTLEQKVFFCGD